VQLICILHHVKTAVVQRAREDAYLLSGCAELPGLYWNWNYGRMGAVWHMITPFSSPSFAFVISIAYHCYDFPNINLDDLDPSARVLSYSHFKIDQNTVLLSLVAIFLVIVKSLKIYPI
jgi:hypothetical protein